MILLRFWLRQDLRFCRVVLQLLIFFNVPVGNRTFSINILALLGLHGRMLTRVPDVPRVQKV